MTWIAAIWLIVYAAAALAGVITSANVRTRKRLIVGARPPAHGPARK